jgi:hypothetical protein
MHNKANFLHNKAVFLSAAQKAAFLLAAQQSFLFYCNKKNCFSHCICNKAVFCSAAKLAEQQRCFLLASQ